MQTHTRQKLTIMMKCAIALYIMRALYLNDLNLYMYIMQYKYLIICGRCNERSAGVY